MMYVQCQLISGNYIDTRWIPETLAKVGKSFVVKETGEEWFVKQAFSKAHEKSVIQMRDLHKHHRKGTDV